MLLYNIGIRCYYILIRMAALFNPKARLWVDGRKRLFEQIEATLAQRIKPGDKVIWLHCASLGEFEQGRPVLEELNAQGYRVVLTFFSPSGYEIRKNYPHAAAVFYLPIDTPANAKRFVELLKPHAALFVKYEFWLNYLAALREKAISTHLVSGVFRPDQHFFKWYGKSFFRAIQGFKTLFVQDENSFNLLKRHGFTNMVLAGDTRFDRVMEIAGNRGSFPDIEAFAGNEKLIIAGSTWPMDEKLLLETFTSLRGEIPGLKMILAPHEVDAASIGHSVERAAASGARYARFTEGHFADKEILILDTIGMLSQLYQYAHAAYVGGGFNDGIHNILEVLAHGVPVAFGPNHHKFVEAREAAELQLARPVSAGPGLAAFFKETLLEEAKGRSVRAAINDWMRSKTGATGRICRAVA